MESMESCKLVCLPLKKLPHVPVGHCADTSLSGFGESSKGPTCSALMLAACGELILRVPKKYIFALSDFTF